MRVRKREWIAIAVFLAAALVVPRLEAGPVAVVKFDLLMRAAPGNGYASPALALATKFGLGVVAVASLAGLLANRRLWRAWLVLGVGSALGSASIQLESPNLQDVTQRGSRLVRLVQSFHSEHGRYPAALSELKSVPGTGLAPGRRFCYVCRASIRDDKADWMPSTRHYLGKADYVICVPLCPRGTLLYRPSGDYSDLPGSKLNGGWFHTNRD